MEIIRRVISWEGEGDNGGKCAEIKKYKLIGTEQAGGFKKNIGNGEAKELICTDHGHELWGELMEGIGVLCRQGQRGKMEQQ